LKQVGKRVIITLILADPGDRSTLGGGQAGGVSPCHIQVAFAVRPDGTIARCERS
jgi:hypothetical protein